MMSLLIEEFSVFVMSNKTGTSKVGAISKAQKSAIFLNLLKGDPFDFLEIQSVAKYQKS